MFAPPMTTIAPKQFETSDDRELVERHLAEIARFVEPHWKGAGLKLESGWIIRELMGWAKEIDDEGDRADRAEAALADANTRIGERDALIEALEKALRNIEGGSYEDWASGIASNALRRARAALTPATEKEPGR